MATTNVLNLPYDYIIKAVNGTVTIDTNLTKVTEDFLVKGDSVLEGNTQIGDSRADDIDPQGSFINSLIPRGSGVYNVGDSSAHWGVLHVERGRIYSENNVNNPFLRPYDPGDIYDSQEHRQYDSDGNPSALYVYGGVGIEKDLNVGGHIYGRIELANTSTFMQFTTTNETLSYNLSLILQQDPEDYQSLVYIDNEGISNGLTYTPYAGRLTTDRIQVAETDQATSIDTGVLNVAGGVGITKNLVVGEEILPNEDLTGSIGSTTTQWAESFIHDMYTRVIKSTTGTVQIDPAAGVTEILGDIRVRGTNPIGTAPVVTNTLYVTMDGDDTNDGRAMDPSRACRTIGGALNSPYYQSGTQIRVAAGHYLENNPLQLKPYTSIMGADIRTTSIEPINKTQDLFHLNSGCYLAFMQFLNGRSGLLEGQYAEGFNRGAYATAFPPLEGDERIDLYHSPYVQNCTNLSGPWLKDGTMFVPNEVVQVPSAVGIGSWLAGTATIIVDVGNGVIERGMKVNVGQQNPGFFDARTLMLANKPFLQEQVVEFVDKTFNTGTFIYDHVKCSRDTGLIVDSIAIDMLQDSTSESIFAGLQYWRQSGYVDAIGDQLTTTTAAINFVKAMAVSTATAAASAVEGSVVAEKFDIILNVLSTATSTLATGEFAQWVTDSIVSNSTASNVTSYIDAFNALIASKEVIANATVDYINSTLTPFSYNDTKCARDTRLIIDSVVQDLLFESTSQSKFAGIQYWNQSGYVDGIADEITTTTNAISYVKTLAQKVVLGDTSGTRYQSAVAQNRSLSTATNAEVATIGNDFDVILNILNVGTNNVTNTIQPNGVDASTSVDVVNAYNLLLANREYLKAEAVAFVEATKTIDFEYDQALCSRDVGYMVDSVSFDLLYGGNKQAIQSGVYYYGYNSVTTIPNEIPQVTLAYQYIKQLLDGVIRNVKIADSELYQLVEDQVAGTPGTPIEVNSARSKIDIIIDIINNGPAGVVKEPISLVRTRDQYAIAAAKILNANREFITQEVISYVNTLTEFLYDQEKCRRDVGYMIDSVAFDLLHGGNKQSYKSGVYYFGYNTDVTEIPEEVPQTFAAYSFIKSLLSNIVKRTEIISPYQSTVPQDITSYLPGSDAEVAALSSKIDIITNIIRNGPSVVDARIPINTTQSNSSNVYNAYKQIEANRDFIRAEVNAYLDTFGQFDYSREFCFRDVGILVENIAYDAAFGGNEKAIESGLAYYNGVVSKIAGQEVQTVAAIDYLNTLVQKVITNTTCPNLAATPKYSQVKNTALTGGAIATRSIKNLFNVISKIIENGPSAAPAMYNGTNVDSAYVSAEILMQANRKFIQEDTISYINNLVLDFPYSERLCRRDTGLIVDSITMDLLYPTVSRSQSLFAGLQYWNKDSYVGDIKAQLSPTVKAVEYLRDLSVKIVQNITPADDLVARYQSTVTQVTSLEPASAVEAATITKNFSYILEILNGSTTGWTDRIIPNGLPSDIASARNAIALLTANKDYLANEVTAYVDATNYGFVYDAELCRRDAKLMVDAVGFDLLHGGNRQSIQNGLYYFGFDDATTTIRNQEMQTSDAFNHLSNIAQQIVLNVPVTKLQSKVGQVFLDNTGTVYETYEISQAISTITNIIANGPAPVATEFAAISMTASTTATVSAAVALLNANKQFIVEEVIAYIDQTYNPNSFNYDEALCYRDVGLIVDAVSQDVLLGGNFKSVEAGLAYWNYGVSHVNGQETTTTMALNYARDLALQIVSNVPVTPQTGTNATQVINPFFQYGNDYMPQQSIRRSFDIVTGIINRGPEYAPPKYMGGGLFPLTGINGADVQTPPEVVSVVTLEDGRTQVGLSYHTIGFGNNSTLYFGNTLTYPLKDSQVEALSLEYTGNTSTWDLRKTDPIGSMGGSLVDGKVISARSPIQSFVYDAFTQLTQGGRGIHITNDGYAQLVSVFTIFSSVGVQTDNGGIASIVNSNANFGDICLLSKGYGTRQHSGQIYNPAFKAFPESPDIPGSDYFDQYYPSGFWPNNAQVAVYMPDADDRPHISLVMEIVPPDGHINEQGFPGFLNASPTTSTLTTGTITLTDIGTENVYIGNSVYIRDQFGHTTSTVMDLSGNWIPYVAPGTVVTDVGYNSITLNKALPSGGGEVDNNNFFDFYFCGNSYYTVLSSEVITPKRYNKNGQLIPPGVNILSTASTGGDISQVPAHVAALSYLNDLTNLVIANEAVTSLQSGGDAVSQTVLPLVRGGAEASSFIDLRFGEIVDIVDAPDLAAAEAVIKPSLRVQSGPAVQGGGSAITLIERNIDFLAKEVNEFVKANFTATTFTYDQAACERDSEYILNGAYFDAALGTNFNAIRNGLAYRRGVAASVTATEFVQTIGAINFLQERAANIVAASTTATSRVIASLDEVMNIITEGEGAANALVLPIPDNKTGNNDTVRAKNLLAANKAFMQAEIIAWINSQVDLGAGIWAGFSYNSAACARDVGDIIDCLCYDVLYDGNYASLLSANAYFDNAASVLLPGEISQTVAAFGRLRSIAQDVVLGNEVIASPGNTVTQNRSLPAATATEANLVDALIFITENAVNAGTLSVVPALLLPDASWADPITRTALDDLSAAQSGLIQDMVVYINDEFVGTFTYDEAQCQRDVKTILQRLIYDIETGGRYNSVMCGLSYWNREGTYHKVQLGENVLRTDLFPHNATVNFYQRSYISASGYVFEYVGAGTNYGALPQRGVADPVQSKETVQLDSGKVFFTSTDQNGDFRIGPGLVISQATGVLSGRTFTKSLFANMTPFILAIEAGMG